MYPDIQGDWGILQVDVKVFIPDWIEISVDSFGLVHDFIGQLEFDVRIAGPWCNTNVGKNWRRAACKSNKVFLTARVFGNKIPALLQADMQPERAGWDRSSRFWRHQRRQRWLRGKCRLLSISCQRCTLNFISRNNCTVDCPIINVVFLTSVTQKRGILPTITLTRSKKRTSTQPIMEKSSILFVNHYTNAIHSIHKSILRSNYARSRK